ncbi:hypothetical protein B0J14DRAFT_606742 [Halenospora varia]|nr:hypothetical protein B0J14DRAFT_606742 [Halenospora varia]
MPPGSKKSKQACDYCPRNFYNYIDKPLLATIQSSFFLFAVFFCLKRDNTACNGLLSSKSAIESLSFRYPVTIARDIILALRLLPLKAIQANRIGILEKVFDISYSLVDVLLVNPNIIQVLALEIRPRDYLIELVQIFLRLLSLRADKCLRVRLRRSLCLSNDSYRVYKIYRKEAADTSDVVFRPMILIGSS